MTFELATHTVFLKTVIFSPVSIVVLIGAALLMYTSPAFFLSSCFLNLFVHPAFFLLVLGFVLLKEAVTSIFS